MSLTVKTDSLSASSISSPQVEARILSLAPSHTEWVFALGAHQKLVGRTDHCDLPPEVSSVSSIGSLFPPQLERIVAAQPSDALMISGHVQLKAQLERLGIRVHTLQPHSLEEIFIQAQTLGRILQRETRATQWIERARMRLKELKPLKRRPSVMIEIWHQPLTLAGAESFMGSLVRAAGGVLYPQGRGEWPTLSLEELITHQPEVILVSTLALYKLLTGPLDQVPTAWRALLAVQRGRVYRLQTRLTRPGPRIIDEIIWLNEHLRRL